MSLAKTALFVRRAVGGLFAVEDQALSTGLRVWVHSGTGTDAAGYGSGPDKPVATIDYAMALCTGSKGDLVYVMPGHAESIASATGLVMDIIGVSVIGLGNGRLKPQITIDTADTALISVTAANCAMRNVDVITNFLDVATVFSLGAAADGFTFDGVDFYDTSVVLGALIGISIAALCDDVTVRNCNYYGLELSAPATDFLVCAGEANRLRVESCYLKGEFSGNIIDHATTASVDLIFKDLLLTNLSETGGGIDLNAASTGMAHNVQAYLEDQTANEPAITGTALAMTDSVRQTNVVTASTFLCISADS